jgi:hypothetical protein
MTSDLEGVKNNVPNFGETNIQFKMKSYPKDYLKYWRVVSYYIKAKYNLKQAELDLLLFLYSEKYFSRDRFDQYNKLLSWDKRRFEKLQSDKWIEVFRKRAGRHRAIYQLSLKATRLVEYIYQILNGEEIGTHRTNNPLFKRNVSTLDRFYRDMIIDMTEFTRQQRHHALELSCTDCHELSS